MTTKRYVLSPVVAQEQFLSSELAYVHINKSSACSTGLTDHEVCSRSTSCCNIVSSAALEASGQCGGLVTLWDDLPHLLKHLTL